MGYVVKPQFPAVLTIFGSTCNPGGHFEISAFSNEIVLSEKEINILDH